MVQFDEAKDNAGLRSRNVSNVVTSRPTDAVGLAKIGRDNDIQLQPGAANQDSYSEEVDQVGESLT